MRGYGKDGSDLERMQPGDTDTAKKIKQMAESRDFMKNNVCVGTLKTIDWQGWLTAYANRRAPQERSQTMRQ
jgi:hypothetical protein